MPQEATFLVINKVSFSYTRYLRKAEKKKYRYAGRRKGAVFEMVNCIYNKSREESLLLSCVGVHFS